MSEVFVKPVRVGEMKIPLLSPKNAELKSFPGDKVYSPYNGVVVDNPNKSEDCINELLIHHEFRGGSAYSQFCNVGKTFVFNGDKVKTGEMIGEFGDKDISYSIRNKKDSKLELQPFFTPQEEPKSEPVAKKEDEKSKKKEKDKKPINTNDKSKKPTSLGGYESSGNVFLDALLLPFAPSDMIFGPPEETNEDLHEEIQRIKKIIKH